MRKYGKIVLLLAVMILIAAPLLYKYVLFDDEPFDDIRAGEIESVIIRYSDDIKKDVIDISSFANRLEDLELEKRRDYIINDSAEQVKAFIHYRGGKLQTVTVSSFYIQIDDKLYKADYESASEFIAYTQSLLKD